jgi:two-component sensor histidine kinase
MDGRENPDAPSVDMAFAPKLEQVSAVREFLENYYLPVLRDPDLVCRLAVAAHELLENAAKYSGGGISRLQVKVQPGHGDASNGHGAGNGHGAVGTLSVCVWNVIRPDLIDELKVTVDELSAAPDPFAIYQTYLARAAKRTEGSGLGLARIRAEADMRLSLKFQGDRVGVEAVAPLAPSEGP